MYHYFSSYILYIYRYVSNEECACITMPACLKGVHVSLCPVKGVCACITIVYVCSWECACIRVPHVPRLEPVSPSADHADTLEELCCFGRPGSCWSCLTAPIRDLPLVIWMQTQRLYASSSKEALSFLLPSPSPKTLVSTVSDSV